LRELRKAEVQLRRIPLLRTLVNRRSGQSLTTVVDERISKVDNQDAKKTPSSRVAPGGGGPTKDLPGPRGESPANASWRRVLLFRPEPDS
jgi:hypothetical protein